MITLRDKTINLSSLTEEDKKIKSIEGNTLSVQIDGSIELTVKGKHSNFDSSSYYVLGAFDLSNLTKVDKITAPGLYMFIVEGVDEIVLDIKGSAGKIHWKELGD